MYRTNAISDFVTFVDLDEIIHIHGNDTLIQFMTNMLERNPRMASAQFGSSNVHIVAKQNTAKSKMIADISFDYLGAMQSEVFYKTIIKWSFCCRNMCIHTETAANLWLSRGVTRRFMFTPVSPIHTHRSNQLPFLLKPQKSYTWDEYLT